MFKCAPPHKFRQLLNEPGIITAPGAYDCLTAAIIERTGFPAVYMTGAGTSVARIGYPDLALATATEMLANAAYIAGAVEIPVIADADTGYGGTMNVRRTIREYERTGVAAVHIEDQQFPKRCGHLEDKRVVSIDEMTQKIRAAVDARTDDDFTIIVRTDALAVTGWDDTMRRCDAFTEAGADALFVEAIRSSEEAAEVVARTSVPLLYNFVETGKSPLLNVSELERLGFKMVIFPRQRVHVRGVHGRQGDGGTQGQGHHRAAGRSDDAADRRLRTHGPDRNARPGRRVCHCGWRR